jgi:hypothetical protein
MAILNTDGLLLLRLDSLATEDVRLFITRHKQPPVLTGGPIIGHHIKRESPI